MRAILTGDRYPRALLAAVIMRMRADGAINGLRAAICKACLARDCPQGHREGGIPVGLEPRSNLIPAYRLGRLFAVLESVQRAALGNSTRPSAIATTAPRRPPRPRCSRCCCATPTTTSRTCAKARAPTGSRSRSKLPAGTSGRSARSSPASSRLPAQSAASRTRAGSPSATTTEALPARSPRRLRTSTAADAATDTHRRSED